MRPEKDLGQHFLTDPTVILKIVEAASFASGILEIGPGPGVITRPLGGLGIPLIALEIDTKVARVARGLAPDADVRIGDALATDLDLLLTELPEPRAVVSNMPYYITHPLTEKILASRGNWSKAVLMMQREVAEKWLAKPGDRRRGSFSVYLQAICEIEKISHVPAASFLPAPQVDSTVLRLTPRTDVEWPKEFDRFVRQAFAQPRKTLANNLTMYGREKVADFLDDPLARAHELTEDALRQLYAAVG